VTKARIERHSIFGISRLQALRGGKGQAPS